MLKVWWVTQYGFCWKFTALCSSEGILQIDHELTRLYPWLRCHPFLTHGVVTVMRWCSWSFPPELFLLSPSDSIEEPSEYTVKFFQLARCEYLERSSKYCGLCKFGKQLQESPAWLCRVGHIKASAYWVRHHQVSSIKNRNVMSQALL